VAPGFDPLPGDGAAPPGRAPARLATGLIGSSSPGGSAEYELGVRWTTLGVSPGTPLGLHLATNDRQGPLFDPIAHGLPAGIRDNAGIFATGFAGLSLAPGRPGPGAIMTGSPSRTC
jgi:hypothetical protein